MKKTLGVVCTVMVVLLLLGLNGLALGQKLPEIKFEKYVLPNGLQVILHEDHSTPMVAVNIWYHVGSKNEKVGRTGFAHLFEHMMFQGTEHLKDEYFQPLEKIGGSINGSTSEDRTNYWENVPSNYLSLALWMEADRLGFLLPAMDQAKLDNQRDVVKNERRQGVENEPYGKVDEIMLEALFPYSHPYSWSVIGSQADLSAAALEDVKDFFRTYYTPSNASLCIAGDFKPEEAKKWVEMYFVDIPPGPPVDRITNWVPQLEGVKRINMTDNVSLPRIYITWPTPPNYQPGDAELDILASILSDGKNSRLYKTMVYDTQIAQDVQAYQYSMESASYFQIIATAKPGRSVKELERAIDAELQQIITKPPTGAEVQTAVNAWEARFVRQLQAIGGFGGKADQLNRYNVMTGNPNYFQIDLHRYYSVTPVAVQKAAQQYLALDKRVIITVVPFGDLAAAKETVDRTQMPPPTAMPPLVLPTFQEQTLSNGLKVVVAERHNLPLVQMSLIINAGWAADPTDKPGVASLTSDLQDEGTKNRTALQISDELKSIGANLNTSSFFDGNVVSLNTLKKHLTKALDIFTDVLVNPTFPDEELTRKKKMYIAQIMQEKREPFTSSLKTFMRILYGKEHPYGQPFTGTGTEESIQAITRADLIDYYHSYFAPNNAVLVVVGDVNADEIIPVLEKGLKTWKAKEVPPVVVSDGPPLSTTQVYLVDKPGAAQSFIIMGNYGVARNTPDYYKIQVMNTLLGGKFTSRINLNLREDKGYTYGARSLFLFLKGTGPFLAYAPVHTQYTKESLIELLKELKGITGDKPVTADELQDTKNGIVFGYPKGFETIGQIAGRLTELYTYNLPSDYFDKYIPAIQAVQGDEVLNVAKKYVHPSALLIVVVGDVSKIESGIRELNLGEIHYLDADGNLVTK